MPNKQDKRTRILKAAVRVFADKGFYNAKVAEIARKAGVADGTIYLYFKNKDEILILIFEEEMERIIATMKQEIAAEKSIPARIGKFIRTHLELVRRNPKLAQVFQVELRQSNRFIKEYTGTKIREYLNIIGGLIEAGQEQGVIRKDVHPGVAKRALFGALDEIATHWVLSHDGRYDLNQSAEQLVHIFIHGIASHTNPNL